MNLHVGNNKLGSAVGLLKLYVLLYADDACILARSKEGLDEGMKYLYDYCRQWKMTLNVTKTKNIIFGWKSYISPPEFKYNNETVEVVNMFCYLGVLLTHNLSWDAHVTMVCEKSLKACYMSAKYCYKYRLTVKTKCKLFEIFIEPALRYGAELWGFSTVTTCESVHLRFLKDLLCLKSMTRSEIVYAECKRIPLICLGYIKIILFWLKLVSNDNDMLCCKLYKNMLPINNV